MTTICLTVRNAKVTRVIDGDTIDVEVALRDLPPFVRRVRLKSWSPEMHEEGGSEAQRHLQALCLYELVDVEVGFDVAVGFLKSATTFDRFAGDVFLDGRSLSQEMIAAGHATKTKPRKAKR